MATKAENARTEARRALPKRPKQVVKPKRHANHSGGADRKKHGESNSLHNLQGRQRDDSYVHEASATKPSRKSTRASKDHTKAGIGMQQRQTARTTSPAARASRGR